LVREKRRFFDFDSLPWQRPLKNKKSRNEVSKPLHLSTNSEILVKIAPLVSELRWLESRPLKKNKKIKKKTSVKYIALPASLPSGLRKKKLTQAKYIAGSAGLPSGLNCQF